MSESDRIQRQLEQITLALALDPPPGIHIRALAMFTIIQCAVLIARGEGHDPHARLAMSAELDALVPQTGSRARVCSLNRESTTIAPTHPSSGEMQ